MNVVMNGFPLKSYETVNVYLRFPTVASFPGTSLRFDGAPGWAENSTLNDSNDSAENIRKHTESKNTQSNQL